MQTVLYDADCGICTRVKETMEALDWLATMRWIPNRSAEAATYGIPLESLDHAVYIVGSTGERSGFAAVQAMVARLPLTWFVIAYVIAKRPWTALLFAFLFSSLAVPAGQPLYDLVAQNRYRIPGSTCDNQIK